MRIFNAQAQKEPINLSINSDLLKKARGLKINLSAILEKALALEIKRTTREQWLAENKEAMEALNDLAEENGLFSDSYREF